MLHGMLAFALSTLAQPPADLWMATMPPMEEHPCLLLSADDIPRMRERLMQEPYAAWWQTVQASRDIVSRAFVWRMTGDDEAAKAVVARLLEGYPSGYHCCCGVADALSGYAEAYDLIHGYPGLSPDEDRVIRAKIAAACERLYLSALESGPGQHPGNQRTRGICALGTAALVLREYGGSAHTPLEWLQRALDGIHDEANLAFWRDDGMFIEGPGYSSFTLSVMMPFARYYERISGRWLFDEPRLRNALRYLVHITQPDGYSTPMGTTNMVRVADTLRLAIGAGPAEDQAFYRWALEEWGHPRLGGLRELCLFDASVAPSVAGEPTSLLCPVSQEAAFRSEWSASAVALWFRGRDPWLARNYGVYSHGDVGSFVLHAYGEILAVDAGYDHWVSYDLYPPELHNCLLVDGAGPESATEGLFENVIDAPFIRGGDVRATYAGVDLQRTFLLVDGRYAIILDDVRSEAEHDYAWQVHTPVSRGSGTVTLDGNRAAWTGFDPVGDLPGRVAIEAVWAPPVELATMDRSRWQPYDADPVKGSYDNWAIIAKRHARDVRYAAVLYPHPVALPGPTIEAPPVENGRCLTVSDGLTRDTILVSEGGNVTSGRLSTDARACVVRERNGAVEWLYVAGRGRVAVEGQTVCEASGGAGGAVAVAMAEVAPIRLHVAGKAGMRVGIRAPEGVRAAWFCTGTGEPQAMPVQAADGLATFALPEDAPTGAMVILSSDTGAPSAEGPPPVVLGIAVDGQDEPAREIVDLGRRSSPRAVLVRFAEGASPLDVPSARVTVDGMALMPEAFRIAPLDEPSGLSLQATVPQVLDDRDHEIVMSVLDTAALPRRAQVLVRFSMRPLLSDGGFERGDGSWRLGSWADDTSGRYEAKTVSEGARSGRRCLMLRGIALPLNVVASQEAYLTVGHTYVLTGYYRGDVAVGTSLCSYSGAGQYLRSPPIGPSTEWVPFRMEFTVENAEQPLLIGLRLGEVGTAYFDDLELTEK